ncbi:hypothetical protein C8J57DRAFT_1221509 [Mycena rebaudengoi]|nr:hypothetical protein C8J57DRAFT_1221509 [Mycena rebaudengoi]
MKEGPSKTPADRQRCIDNLGVFMSAILRGVYEYTGLHSFAVFGGPIPQFGGEIRTVHISHGRNRSSPPSVFPQWSRGRFTRDVLDFMKEYLHTAFTPADCAEMALPIDDPKEKLSAAKYMVWDGNADTTEQGVEEESSDSGDDSSSDEDGDTDESGSDTEGRTNGRREKGKKTAKEAGNGRDDALATMAGVKRKRRVTGGGGSSKRRTGEPAPSRDVGEGSESEPEAELTYKEKRNQNIARNRTGVAALQAAFVRDNPSVDQPAAKVMHKPRAKKAPTKTDARCRSQRLDSSGSTDGSVGGAASDVEMGGLPDTLEEGAAPPPPLLESPTRTAAAATPLHPPAAPSSHQVAVSPPRSPTRTAPVAAPLPPPVALSSQHTSPAALAPASLHDAPQPPLFASPHDTPPPPPFAAPHAQPPARMTPSTPPPTGSTPPPVEVPQLENGGEIVPSPRKRAPPHFPPAALVIVNTSRQNGLFMPYTSHFSFSYPFFVVVRRQDFYLEYIVKYGLYRIRDLWRCITCVNINQIEIWGRKIGRGVGCAEIKEVKRSGTHL